MASPTAAVDKLFVCPGCQRGGFKSMGAVKAHFESKGHKLACSPCDKSFGNVTALLKHSQKHEKPLDGSDLKSVKSAKPAPKSTKQQRFPDLSESFVKAANPPPKITKPKRSQDPSEPLSVNPAKSIAKKTKPEKSQELLASLAAKPAKPIPKKIKFEKSLDRSEIMPAKSAKPAQKHTSNQASVGAPLRTDDFEDLWTKTSEPLNISSPAIQNANYHVLLEPLEQNLIFRYLSARCHSDTRLVTRGFTFRDSLADVSRRPSKKPSPKTGHFRQVPRPSDNLPRRRAIVLDCEMVQVEAGRRELAFLSAIDFLTGEVLIDNYVQPKSRVVNWDSRFSGVTPSAMNKAVRKGTALFGWEEARSKLWEFMDSETILIGHSLNNDLDVLGIIHWNIVDSSIITSEAVFYTVHAGEPLNRTWSLKTLTNELVNYDIQVGKQGHSALEDAHATRDIVIWCLRYPEHLKVWADNARDQEEQRMYERELKRTTEEQVREQRRQHDMEIKMQLLSQGVGGLGLHGIGLSDDDANDPDSSFVDRDGDVEYESVTIEAAAVSFF
ncbi:hypothetical protein DTO013E5_9326 [Penicillium roqueforti]|uniref:Ribonuclease H-like domain n=1 Tax=Penicillium roqueforti (strain FM164) TaxID=1365484 RepID=W6QJV1_PENRF|nr:hypothetical protein CBS147337_9557 [Penicillium roqueforti]CDM37098.1 Ribonuclease H-like domain [Penicillium roqueforti FM164]KAI2669962.1 hypothetical protein CBS147355_9550 [Penicillium roqueforti]KAI2671902.1 hypothetical protein LCP963914a_9533 [Penicillium roqueforti]KAI2695268.1 hypothetical protein CBS147372_9272 [Penicillium roqueforti]